MKKFIIPFTIFLGTVLIPYKVFSGATRIIEADQIRSGAALLSLPSATDTIVGRATTDTLTNKTLNGNTATNLISGSGTIVHNTSGTITVPNGTDTLVGKATTDTLTNKTLTGNTAVSLISGSGTLVLNTTGTATVPNATDTLVGKATTDTLTNKTLTGNTAVNLISGSGTLVLNTSGTATVPNGTDTLVGKATTDTLTNKTLTSPAINTPNVDGGTASNTSRVTIPKDTLTNLTALTRKEGNLFYATDQVKMYFDTGAALVAMASASYNTQFVEFGGGGDTANCTSSPCSIARSSSGVSSVTRGSTGNYTINFSGGTFSAAPVCTFSSNQNGTGISIPNKSGTPTTTAVSLEIRNAAGTDVDSHATAICVGAN